MTVGGKPPPAFCSWATVPFGWPVALRPAGSPPPDHIVCPATPVTYSRAVPLELWNMIRLPTVIGRVTPAITNQPTSSITDPPTGSIVPAQEGGPTACTTGKL